ncbi:hypothetical protein ACFOHS_07595 [Jhaorihella thermophila]
MSAAPRILCVGTHHKTGTVWMRRVWREIAQALDIPFQPVHRPEKWAEKLPAQGRVIVPNWGGRFAPDLWEREDARFLHVIRDPRDVLLSGARYHDSTSAPTEKNGSTVQTPSWVARATSSTCGRLHGPRTSWPLKCRACI